MLWSIQYNRQGIAQARHLHVTVSQVLGGPYRSTSMHGITYMHLAPFTVTDKQLQPLRYNQQPNNALGIWHRIFCTGHFIGTLAALAAGGVSCYI
jgi:hypothetical protein